MLSVSMQKALVTSIERNGKPVLHELWGTPYERVLRSLVSPKELRVAIECFEEENPMERAKRLLREYEDGLQPHGIEICECIHKCGE